MTLTPKNWKSFQHYKDRSPAWIKLHKGLLDDFEFHRLPLASRALAPMLWLLASEHDDGGIDASFEKLAFRLRLSESEFTEAVTPLIDSGFIVASELLADCKQDAIPERERERQEKIDSEANASGAVAPLDDLRSQLFGRGLATIAKLTGRGPDACRSFVGKCLKASSDDAGIVLGLIEDAERNRVIDPSAWIAARLKERGPPLSGKPLTEHQRKQHQAKGILNDLKNFATGGSGSGGENPRLLGHDTGERPGSVRSGAGENIIDLPPSGYRSSG